MSCLGCMCVLACSTATAPRKPSRPIEIPALLPEEWVEPVPDEPESAAQSAEGSPADAGERSALPEPEPLPILRGDDAWVFREGEPVGPIARADADASDLIALDLGEAWVPPLFRSTPESAHEYEPVFIALANGRFGDDPEGRRAARERYLEPHGILPSPALLARRFASLSGESCAEELDLQTLHAYPGIAWPEGTPAPAVPEDVVHALQARLHCEDHLRVSPSGRLDEDTRRALEEFERRNRIYARANLTGETLEALRAEPLELERRTLVRVLSERVILDLAVLEDGSGAGATTVGKHDELQVAPNVVQRIRERVVEAFGLQTVEGVRRFYGRLERTLTEPHAVVAIESVRLPDYYRSDMDLWVEIDRGDFYYEFPFDETGQASELPIERGPTLTLFARDRGRVLPLAQYPTTIGGWRVRRRGDGLFWEYKESPVGRRAWRWIMTAPVWLPPRSTPADTFVTKLRRVVDRSEFHELNHSLVGPSFASAYGLIAAYHQHISGEVDGELQLGRDDGIRTHGSSDYTSIWRTVSSGCHRLHNHLALRLFNFILAHREHRRVGHRPVRYKLHVSTPEVEGVLEAHQSGYQFVLDPPIELRILPGRNRGTLDRPLRRRIPAADDASERPVVVFTPTPPS